MRKIVSAILAAVLVWTALPVLPSAAEAENLFQNGDFETLVTDAQGRVTAEHWGFWDSYWTDISHENPHSGSTCVRISNPESTRNPRITQVLPQIVPGDIYTASYYIRVTNRLGGSGAFSFRFLYFDSLGNELPLISGKTLTSQPGTEWEKFEMTFAAPENVASLRVDLQLNGIGAVYVDDAFFGLTATGSDFTVDSNAVFFYDDYSQTPSVTVTDKGNTGTEAVFTLKKGEETVISAQTITFLNGKAVFSFPLTMLSAYAETYTVWIEVHKTAGDAEIFSRDIYKIKRPSRLSRDGTYYKKDGTPFVPVIGYHVDVPPDQALPSQNPYRKCKQMGINVVTLSYWFADYAHYTDRLLPAISKAHENGLMVIIGLYRNMLPGGHEYNIENTRRIVELLKDSEDVFAFTLMDEPLLHDRVSAESTMLPGYLAVRQISDSIPVLTVDHRGNIRDYKRVANYCDILMPDAYPTTAAQTGDQFAYVGENVSMAIHAAEEGERTVYSLVQAFNWAEFGYYPTAAEILHFVYQSLLAGVKGIGYFAISNADTYTDPETGEKTNVPLYKTDRWEELVRRCTGELAICLRAFITNKRSGVTDLSGVGFSACTWKDGEAEYLLLINRENEEKTVHVPIDSTFFYTAVYGEDISGGSADGVLDYTLLAGEAVLLEISHKLRTGLYSMQNMPQGSLVSGDDMRLSILLPPRRTTKAFYTAIYGENGKELLLLYLTEAPISESLTTESVYLHVPNVDEPSYKVFWRNGLVPRLQ